MSAALAVTDARRGMIAKLHLAKKQLALTDECYRAVLTRLTGKNSAAVLSERELDVVLGEFKRLGFRPLHRQSETPHVRKVWALWGSMNGLVADPSRAALRAFVRRQTGLSDPEFLSPAQANQVIEGLKAWRARLRSAGP